MIFLYKDEKSLFDIFTKRQTEYLGGHIKNNEPLQSFEYFFEPIHHHKEKGYLFPIALIRL